MADTSPARALDQVRWIEAMCDIIEDADVQSIIITKMVPVSMPPRRQCRCQNISLGWVRNCRSVGCP